MVENPDKPVPAIPITSADRIRLSTLLAQAIEDREECPICFDISKTWSSFSVLGPCNILMTIIECSLGSSYNAMCSYLLPCMHLGSDSSGCEVSDGKIASVFLS